MNNNHEETEVKEGAADQEFTCGNSDDGPAINEKVANVKSWERCFNEKINREIGNYVDTVEDRIQNAILTALDSIITPKIEVGARIINASSKQFATNVVASSELGIKIGVTAPFEKVSERNKTLHVSNTDDEIWNKIPNGVNELPVPVTHFDRQPHTNYMVTGQTTQTNPIPEILTGRNLAPRELQSL